MNWSGTLMLLMYGPKTKAMKSWTPSTTMLERPRSLLNGISSLPELPDYWRWSLWCTLLSMPFMSGKISGVWNLMLHWRLSGKSIFIPAFIDRIQAAQTKGPNGCGFHQNRNCEKLDCIKRKKCCGTAKCCLRFYRTRIYNQRRLWEIKAAALLVRLY